MWQSDGSVNQQKSLQTRFPTGSGVQGGNVWRHIVHPFKDIDFALWYMTA